MDRGTPEQGDGLDFELNSFSGMCSTVTAVGTLLGESFHKNAGDGCCDSLFKFYIVGRMTHIKAHSLEDSQGIKPQLRLALVFRKSISLV